MCVELSEAPPGSLTGQIPTLTTDPATPPNSSARLIYSPSTHMERNRIPSDTVKESLSGGRHTTVAWALVAERGIYREKTLRQVIMNTGIILRFSAKPQRRMANRRAPVTMHIIHLLKFRDSKVCDSRLVVEISKLGG